MDDHTFRAHQGLDCFLDQVLARLDQALNGDVVRDAFVLDQAAVEGELGIRGGGESDLNLLEPTLHQRGEHVELLGHIHRHGERLIAIAQIDTAPDRWLGQLAGWPLTIGQLNLR